ncbi:MAG: ethylbenzene dehydrogenase-related protein, partial [Planctomycetota bacterium]
MSRPAGKRAVALSAVLLPLLAACGGSGLIDGGGSGFEEGDTLPGYVHVIPRGSRADVQAKGRYDTGEWTVEICRLLDTGRSDDAKFIVGQETRFSLAVADNSGSVHNGASVVNLIWAGINDPSTVVVGDLAQVFEAAPVIDGDPSDSAWGAVQRSFIALAPQSGDNGITQALVQAGHRDGYLYLRISWDDPTRNDRSARWTRGANDWSRNGENEDRLFLMFDITGARGTATAGQANGTTTPFAQAGCAMACHGDGVMRTDSGRLDIWHWKATRTDPLGVLDDKQLVAAVSGTSGREGDEGDAGYIDNVDGTGIRPGWRSARGTDADPPALFLLGDEIDFKAQKVNDNGFVAGDILPAYVLGVPKNGRSDVWARGGFDNGRWSVEFRRALDSGATFAQGSPVRFRGGGPWQDGDTIPGYVTHPPEGSSADVQAEGAWAAAIWTVEIGRDLDTGRPDDVLFTPGTNLWMSLAVTDNSGGVHNGVPSVSLRWTGTASAFVVVSDPLGAQAPPIIDGDGTDPVWSTVQTSNVPLSAQAGGGNSINQLFVQSVRSATRIYFRFVWVDPTRDGTREQWTRSGGTWSRNSENEDRLFVMFDIDGALGTGTPGADDGMGTTPFAGVPGCTVLCHGDGVMRTDSGKVDIWHWKATRNNGSGWLDDRLADSSGRRADSGAGIATRNERAG